jgi:thioredoxin reductase (NADPH)
MVSEEIKTIEKVIILGTGPAGLSAGLYAARADLAPLIFTGTQIGGQAALTDRIENYPGFPDGVGGNELAELFQKNAEKFGARLEYDTVTKVDLSSRPFKINTYSSGYKAQTLIITTGASPNKLNIPGEEKFLGKGVSYCATCDGWFFKDKAVVVVGGGDSALEEGIFLTRYATSVKIIHRRDELRGSKILQERAFNNPKIEFIWNSVAKEIKGNKGVESIELENVKTGESSEIQTDGFFVFIGHTPNTQIFQSQLEFDAKGYIQVNRNYHTSIPGVFAAGEVCDPVYRQVITSAGMGAAAAIEATRFLEEESD